MGTAFREKSLQDMPNKKIIVDISPVWFSSLLFPIGSALQRLICTQVFVFATLQITFIGLYCKYNYIIKKHRYPEC